MTIYCLHCGKETKNNKFCCHSCSASYNNNSNHWRVKKGIIKKKNKCLNCDFEVKTKYCSIKCQQKYQANQKFLNGTASTRILKKIIIDTHGNKCWECGITSWNNKLIVMELEHKDGNSYNNDLKNLSLLCPNCHSQTPTYKNRNKGNGRYNRRIRYEKGLSY